MAKTPRTRRRKNYTQEQRQALHEEIVYLKSLVSDRRLGSLLGMARSTIYHWSSWTPERQVARRSTIVIPPEMMRCPRCGFLIVRELGICDWCRAEMRAGVVRRSDLSAIERARFA